MDASIRQLLAASGMVKQEENGKNLLIKAYRLLESASKEYENQEGTQQCGADLYVIAAEQAFKFKEHKIANGCLTMYFNGTPLTDQFLCRAYLCKAQILAEASPDSSSALDSSVVYLLKAINFAKDKPRYHFIVYNASLIFWQMSRSFMRDGARSILHTSLQHIVKALEDIDDKDYEWRSTLMILLIQSLIDAGKIKEATKVSEAASEFTLQHSKFQFKEVFRLQIKHQLVDYLKLQKQVKSLPEYTVYFKIQKLKHSLENGEKGQSDVKKEVQTLLDKLNPKPPSRPPPSPIPGNLMSRRDSASSNSSGSASPGRKRSRAPSKAIILPVLTEEDLTEMGKEILKPLLLEMARLCAEYSEVELANECLSVLKNVKKEDTSLDLEIECLECYLLVKNLGDAEEIYTKSSVDVRLFAIRKLDQSIQNAVRSASANVIQAACITQWNLCLPLLQVNLRKHVRRFLTLIAEALESISSLQIMLRCQIHTELAKCEEDVEQVEAAMKHLRKALNLDQTGFYHHRLQTMLRRLELSTQLYKSPESPEDTAAVIIEQARKSADSGSIRMKRSLLVKAGLALAPDAFQYVLDSESEVKNIPGGSKLNVKIHMLGAKASQWKKCIRKATGHLKRLGDENDRERVRLWADLAKVARKQEVWDVCRVAARFCLLYDDDRWQLDNVSPSPKQKLQVQPSSDAPTGAEPVTSTSPENTQQSATIENQTGIVVSNEVTGENNLYNRDLVRLLAEVQFINGEALIHLLQCEDMKLNQVPTSPPGINLESDIDFSFIDNPDWIGYIEWIKHLSTSATGSFLRAIALGVKLRESWIVCSGTAYLWNYNNHLLFDKNYTDLVPVFETALQGLREVGHSSETILMVRMCNVIAQGLLKPWLVPKPVNVPSPEETSKTPASKTSSRNKTPGKDKSPGTAAAITVNADATDDLKKALEVCEYAINVTNGAVNKDIVPTSIRHNVIATWVLLKQMLQQQIGAGLGTDNEMLESQKTMTMAIVALEIHTINSNGMMELTVPTLEEVTEIIGSANWDDPSVELQVWVRMAHLCSLAKAIPLVTKCCDNALKFKKLVKERVGKKPLKHIDIVDFEMLSYAACIQGENILSTVTSNPFARRQAIESFVASAQFADSAGNYNFVMEACKRWWNACLPLMSTAIERELLQKPLHILLHCIISTTMKNREKVEDKKVTTETAGSMKITVMGDTSATRDEDSDNAVRAAMYGIYFQTYTDKGLWEDALNAMDQAVHHMPRTKHRLLIFKHRIMVRAKLGRSVFADIAKFREESEEYVAHMWHRVALSSHEQLQQIQSYQRAIESLHSEETQWKKVDYLAEMAAWLYCNEFPKDDSINVLEWAVDILLNMKFEEVVKVEKTLIGKGKPKKGGKTPSKTPASRGSAKTRDSKRGKKSDEMSKPTTADDKTGDKSDDKKEDKPEDYIPVEKDVIIGLDPSNLDLKINHLNSVRQLDCLIRANVMLATIAGRGTKEHKVYTLLAISYVMRIWNIALTASGPLLSHLPKIEPIVEGKGGKGTATSQPATTKDKSTKRTGPLNAIPEDLISWSTYEPPEDIRRAFIFNTTDTAVSNKTITKPSLTVYYLKELCNELAVLGFNHLSIPALTLSEVIVNDIIESKSWSHLIKIQLVKVCYDLNLLDSAKYWESLVGDKFLPEEEQAMYIQEVELVKQHQKQVQHEEERVKQQAGNQTPVPKEEIQEVISVVTLQGEKLGAPDMKKIWMEKAKAVLELGYHQEARRLLDQSLKAAVFYKEKRLQGTVHLILAQLALQEANLGQAIKYLLHAENIGGDEEYWFKIVQMMLDAIMRNPDVDTEHYEAAGNITKQAITTYKLLIDTRPTKKQRINYYINELQTKMALLKIHYKLLKDTRITKKVFQEISNLEEAEASLNECGFKRELCQIYRKHAKFILKISKNNLDKNDLHSLLLSGMKILSNGIEYLNNMLTSIERTIVTTKDSSMILPIQRELSEISLDYVQFSQEAYRVNAKEKLASKELQAKTGSLEHIVKDYIGKDPHSSATEIEWEDTCSNLPPKLMTILSRVHTLTPPSSNERIRCLHLFGRTLRLLSMFSRDNVSSHWDVSKLNVLPIESKEIVESSALGESEAELTIKKSSTENSRIGSTKSKASEASSLTIRQKTKLIENASRLTEEHASSVTLVSQATEILMQALKVALEQQSFDLISDIALELVEATGQLDCRMTSQFLALHQSAVASMQMQKLIKDSQNDSTVSQFSTLLHQQEWLSKNSASHMLQSTLGEWISSSLLQFNAWKRTQISSKPFDLLKDFPSVFNFVILQHSPDGKYLYASIMDKPGTVTPSDTKGKGKDKQPAASASPSRAFVERFPVDPKRMPKLLESMEDWGIRLMSFLLQTEYQRAQEAMRQKMLQQLTVGNTPEDDASTSATMLEEQEEEERKIIEEFHDILNDLEDYLAPVSNMLNERLIKPLVQQCRDEIKQGTEADPNAMETVVLLLDSLLLQLPFEALSCFQTPFVDCICRDFSLQFMHHRWYLDPEEAAALAEKKNDSKNAKGGAKDSRKTPGGAVKVVPLNRELLPGCSSISTNSFKYVVDPLDETAETEKYKPMEVMKEVLQTYASTCTSMWTGHKGSSGVPSVGIWEDNVKGCEAFIFYGMERFLAHLSPSKVVSMNLDECSLFLLLDKAQTNKSFRHQSKVDVDKSNSQLHLERTMQTVMLLSLAGVNSICINQWHSTLEDNAGKLHSVAQTILDEGRVIGKAIRKNINPTLEKPKPPTPEVPPPGQTKDAKGKGGKGGKDSRKEKIATPEPVPVTPEVEENIKINVEEEIEPVEVLASWCNFVLFGLPNVMVT